MVYLVSNTRSLFNSNKYEIIEFDKAIEILLPLKIVQFDTETSGLDTFLKTLLTIQLGNKENQVVFDWASLSTNDRKKLKEYFESDRTFLGWNLMFDLQWLYKHNIWPKHLWDGMIAEQLIYLGYPRVLDYNTYIDLMIPGYEKTTRADGTEYYELSYSLKAAAKRRCGIDIDKTVRGQIITEGLTESVIVYAASDVMWLEDIKAEQDKELDKQDLQKAIIFECEFLKALAYTKFCGVKLDIDKWEAKMAKDKENLEKATKALNDWVVNWDTDRKFSKIDYQGDLFLGFDITPKCTINWSSSKQVIELFKIIGIHTSTFDKKTKKKKDSIEEKQIAPQAKDFPIISLFLDYQGAAKVVSTYGYNYIKAINPVTGRIHPEYHILGTDTGRIASGGGVYKVNILNLPRDAETRACFVAEKGNVWISADYMG